MDVLFEFTSLVHIIILHITWIWILSLHCGIILMGTVWLSVSSRLPRIWFGLSLLMSLSLNKGLIHHGLLDCISLSYVVLLLNTIQILNILRIYFTLVIIIVYALILIALCFLGFLKHWHTLFMSLLSRLKCCSLTLPIWYISMCGFVTLATNDSLMAISSVSIKVIIGMSLEVVCSLMTWTGHASTSTWCSICVSLVMMVYWPNKSLALTTLLVMV